jgi:hypothetical protein
MNVIYGILAVVGWVWCIGVALFLLYQLVKRRGCQR